MISSSFWIIVVFVGALVLGGAILWAMANNRTSKRTLERTEQATRDLYDGDTADRRSH